MLTREEFAERRAGAVMEEFFTEGEGSKMMAHEYDRADGFIVVEENRVVLSVEDGGVATRFRLGPRDGRLHMRGWGGCPVRQIEGDAETARWGLVEAPSEDAQRLRIQVEGGSCVNIEDSTTELVKVDVAETADAVTITAWTHRPTHKGAGLCAGVGVLLDATVRLEDPLGGRTLIDGGLVPPTPIDGRHR